MFSCHMYFSLIYKFGKLILFFSYNPGYKDGKIRKDTYKGWCIKMSKRQMFKWLKLNGKMQSFFFFILMMITGFVSIKIMFRVFGVYLYSCWRLMFLFLACLLNLGLIDSYLKSLSKLDFNRVGLFHLSKRNDMFNPYFI